MLPVKVLGTTRVIADFNLYPANLGRVRDLLQIVSLSILAESRPVLGDFECRLSILECLRKSIRKRCSCAGTRQGNAT